VSSTCGTLGANHQLSVIINSEPLKHDAYPVNVGVTLDQILKYKQHLSVENCCQAQDLEHKLAGTS